MTEIKTFKTPIKIFKRSKKDTMNKKTQRTLRFNVTNLAEIPEEFFAVKISESTNPELTGKPIFRYISYKLNADSRWMTFAPPTATPATPLAELKAAMVARFAITPDATITMSFPMNGDFGKIECADGSFSIFDNLNPSYAEREGDPMYYIRPDVEVNVNVKEMTNVHGKFYAVDLSTEHVADEVFKEVGAKAADWLGASGQLSSAPEAQAVVQPAVSTTDYSDAMNWG